MPITVLPLRATSEGCVHLTGPASRPTIRKPELLVSYTYPLQGKASINMDCRSPLTENNDSLVGCRRGNDEIRTSLSLCDIAIAVKEAHICLRVRQQRAALPCQQCQQTLSQPIPAADGTTSESTLLLPTMFIDSNSIHISESYAPGDHRVYNVGVDPCPQIVVMELLVQGQSSLIQPVEAPGGVLLQLRGSHHTVLVH